LRKRRRASNGGAGGGRRVRRGGGSPAPPRARDGSGGGDSSGALPSAPSGAGGVWDGAAFLLAAARTPRPRRAAAVRALDSLRSVSAGDEGAGASPDGRSTPTPTPDGNWVVEDWDEREVGEEEAETPRAAAAAAPAGPPPGLSPVRTPPPRSDAIAFDDTPPTRSGPRPGPRGGAGGRLFSAPRAGPAAARDWAPASPLHLSPLPTSPLRGTPTLEEVVGMGGSRADARGTPTPRPFDDGRDDFMDQIATMMTPRVPFPLSKMYPPSPVGGAVRAAPRPASAAA